MRSKKRKQSLYSELMMEPSVSITQLQKPFFYQVYVINDDYTPMEFVVEVLVRYFSMDKEVAKKTMLQAHVQGKSICGLYSHEIAETKVVQANEYSRRNQFPLLCRMEAVSHK